MNELIQFANMFLITNGLFFAALGATETSNDKLKVGLSIAGLLVSLFWITCTMDVKLSHELKNKEFVLSFMPLVFILGWIISFSIHANNWWQETKNY